MASCENNDMSLVEMDLEAIEIDENLLRELLEEEDGKGGNVHDNKECKVESIEKSNVNNPNMIDEEQDEKQHNYVHEFEWINMMDIMEPTNPLDEVMTMNWFLDDNVGKLDFDFGYANGECDPQFCDERFSNNNNDSSYGCL